MIPFPNGLTFMRDPGDFRDILMPGFPLKNESKHIDNTQYLKGYSCFQMFTHAVDLQQIEQLEYCPNRQGIVEPNFFSDFHLHSDCWLMSLSNF